MGSVAISQQYATGYKNGITYADGRVNTSSASYSAGITYADGRVNTSSSNYIGGYNAGITYADGRVNTDSASYKSGRNGTYTVIDLGTGTSFNVASKYSGYANLTASNFVCEPTTGDSAGWGGTYSNVSVDGSTSYSKSYNASSGMLTAYTNFYFYARIWDTDFVKKNDNLNVHAYLILNN